ncbi:hypothetical protein PFICI_07358 [Pestalotiopsis fici W106-1]|uniref:Uncharacterized protein n=1 Tax=Pestalotiopsis fici (strain W106-1 / CGMCC3.15140) TaxID=1229662 RepID=W3X1E6_PESFW|nr:uncharacterized protein PFICI_07358 [Pestalotiopsis fici W106-1]ETS79829.1 hypothetical protein PFICI_07358 [Pestalotiopsis fici W106-1]
MTDILSAHGGHDHSLFRDLFQNALMMPHLMDQLLAISALHLSTLAPQLSRKDMRLCQAAQLRDRALEAFQTEIASENNGLYTSLFYTLSGLHSLCDTLSFRDEFSEVLDRFVLFIRSQQECRRQVQQYSNLRDSPFAPLYQTIIAAAVVVAQECGGHDYDELLCRLETTGLNPINVEVCKDAIKRLQWVSDMRRQLHGHTDGAVHLLLAWPALISDSLINLIDQRQPEALIILTHYAAMLRRSGFWIFTSSGAILEQLISRHLGSYWQDWQEDISAIDPVWPGRATS